MDYNNDGDPVETLYTKNILTKVDAIHFDGLDRTKRDFLHELVQPIFKTRDFGEVIQKTRDIEQRFYELGLFRNVSVRFEESQRNKEPGLNKSLSNISVTFDVEETRRYTGGIYTSASNNAASLILELRSPNLLGRGMFNTLNVLNLDKA